MTSICLPRTMRAVGVLLTCAALGLATMACSGGWQCCKERTKAKKAAEEAAKKADKAEPTVAATESIMIYDEGHEGGARAISVVPLPEVADTTDAARDSSYGAPPAVAAPGPSFVLYEAEGRTWVFHTDSKDIATFLEHGEPAKSTTRIGAGARGETVRAPDADTIDAWIGAGRPGLAQSRHTRPGFSVFERDGRFWAFRSDSKDLATFLEHGEPAKSVTRIGAGPGGRTVRGPDVESIDAWLAALSD